MRNPGAYIIVCVYYDDDDDVGDAQLMCKVIVIMQAFCIIIGRLRYREQCNAINFNSDFILQFKTFNASINSNDFSIIMGQASKHNPVVALLVKLTAIPIKNRVNLNDFF